MKIVYGLFAKDVVLPASASVEELISLVAEKMEEEHKQTDRFVRLYAQLERAMSEVNCSNGWAMRRASEGIRGSSDGRDCVYHVWAIELLDS